MTGSGGPVRQVRIQHVVASGGSIVIQVAGDLFLSEAGLAASWAAAETTPGECPYPGLSAFGPGQARWFFGREKLTGDLLSMLDGSLRGGRAGQFVVVGASGAGKSSLLGAGLVQALGDGRLPETDSERWPIVTITPGTRPLETLTEAVSACAAALTSRTASSPGCVPARLGIRVRGPLRSAAPQRQWRCSLACDRSGRPARRAFHYRMRRN